MSSAARRTLRQGRLVCCSISPGDPNEDPPSGLVGRPRRLNLLFGSSPGSVSAYPSHPPTHDQCSAPDVRKPCLRTEISRLGSEATNMPDMAWRDERWKSLFPLTGETVVHPSAMRPNFGRDRESDGGGAIPAGSERSVYLSVDLARRRGRRGLDAEATSRRHARKERLSGADSGVGHQLVETVLSDLQVQCALGNPELFGHEGQIAVTRDDGRADRLALHRFQVHDGRRGCASAGLLLRFVKERRDLRGEIRDSDSLSGGHQDRALDDVAPFPDIPRPRASGGTSLPLPPHSLLGE